MMRPTRVLAVLYATLFAFGSAACGDSSPDADDAPPAPDVLGQIEHDGPESVDGPHADHHVMHAITLFDEDAAQEYFSDEDGAVATFEYNDAFRQVGFQVDAASVDDFSVRAQREDETWTEWQPVEVYFSEGIIHNGHAVFDEPTKVIETRGIEGVEFAQIEFSEEPTVRDELILRDDDLADPNEPESPGGDDDVRSVEQAVAPSSMVTTRHQWNAISPDKICGSVVSPYRMAIHHTASPSTDGPDPGARMRSMQSYHMNTQGWCDIGYHFVVAQSGEIFQARSRSNRPGAHVGGQNSGNVGISMIGNYTSATPPSAQLDGVATMVRWVHDTHGVAMNRTRVLGHGEHAGQWTSCPGNQALNQINEILDRAGTIGQEPPAEYDATMSVSVSGLDNFYQQGTNSNVHDAFEGETFQAEIILTNKSTDPIRDVTIGYAFDSPGIKATGYRIESDYPAYNKSSWTINSADGAPENPASLGQQGNLLMHAFSPKESKRVVIDLEATQYNVGFDDFAGVRGWLRRIEGVYGVSDSFGAAPGTNQIGTTIRAQRRVNVLSQAEWQFQSGETDDLEGWVGEGAHDRMAINTNDDALAMRATDMGAAIISPDWTTIDGDGFDELVLRTRSHDGEHTKALYWKGDGEEFDEDRSLRFVSQGDGEYHRMVIPVGEHPEWGGQIDGLRLVHLDDRGVEEEDSGWHDVAHLYFQDRQRGETTSHTLGVVEQTPVDMTYPGAEEDVETTDEDSSMPRIPRYDGKRASDDEDEGGGTNVNNGCSATGTTSPTSGWLLAALVLGLVAIRRRN